ncbi:hypothetical protein [Paracoccus kondratievae]|nr:hypothetical protein [Paracoccus kondratievae]
MSSNYDKLHTIPDTAKLLGIKTYALRRAVNLDLIPVIAVSTVACW